MPFRCCRIAAIALLCGSVVAACAPSELPIETRIANALPAVTVMAKGETQAVGTTNDDAADDPAIWRNAADPAASLIVGTDKKAGLHVYGLDGREKSFVAMGLMNNVDLIEDRGRVFAIASDRNDPAIARLSFAWLDTAKGTLHPFGHIATGAGESYGLCAGMIEGVPTAFVVTKDGTIRQVALDFGGDAPKGEVVRTMKLSSQAEGCVVDPRTARLYVAEEDVALWRFDARRGGSTEAHKIADVDGRAIVADAEGVAIAPVGETGGHLLVSSQGDNAYTVYTLADERYVGRFRIAAGAFGSVEETDGIELKLGDFGPDYPHGLFVAQDGMNEPAAQNFKLVSWADIRKAVGIE